MRFKCWNSKQKKWTSAASWNVYFDDREDPWVDLLFRTRRKATAVAQSLACRFPSRWVWVSRVAIDFRRATAIFSRDKITPLEMYQQYRKKKARKK